ncbi:hypothetical protein P692DRAFT_20881771 [Suillus brevipes Sb2]|nr:hypothetical protein P692DRAFT_20881771 [Suillus brevipes Sb2]
MSLPPYILLKSHHRLHTAFAHFRFISANVPALRAPMSPYPHAWTFAPSLDTAFTHFRFSSANVPALRAPMSPYSRASDTLLSHHCNHPHIIQAVVTIISPSLHCVRMHQSRFAQSAILPRFHAPMAPYACAFPALSAPSLRQSRIITFTSDTLALHSSLITYPHRNFALSPLDALSGDTQNLSPQEM